MAKCNPITPFKTIQLCFAVPRAVHKTSILPFYHTDTLQADGRCRLLCNWTVTYYVSLENVTLPWKKRNAYLCVTRINKKIHGLV